jgi:hypothetical protein
VPEDAAAAAVPVATPVPPADDFVLAGSAVPLVADSVVPLADDSSQPAGSFAPQADDSQAAGSFAPQVDAPGLQSVDSPRADSAVQPVREVKPRLAYSLEHWLDGSPAVYSPAQARARATGKLAVPRALPQVGPAWEAERVQSSPLRVFPEALLLLPGQRQDAG